MIIYTKSLLTLSVTSLLLMGCSHEEAGKPPMNFGNSVKQNIAAQIVNPDAPNTNRSLVHNGSRTVLAQERYVSDKVEAAEAETTSSAGASN